MNRKSYLWGFSYCDLLKIANVPINIINILMLRNIPSGVSPIMTFQEYSASRKYADLCKSCLRLRFCFVRVCGTVYLWAKFRTNNIARSLWRHRVNCIIVVYKRRRLSGDVSIVQQDSTEQELKQDFEKTLRSFDDSIINDNTEKVRKYSFNNLFAKVFTKIVLVLAFRNYGNVL